MRLTHDRSFWDSPEPAPFEPVRSDALLASFRPSDKPIKAIETICPPGPWLQIPCFSCLPRIVHRVLPSCRGTSPLANFHAVCLEGRRFLLTERWKQSDQTQMTQTREIEAFLGQCEFCGQIWIVIPTNK